jgi:hypothetical protein
VKKLYLILICTILAFYSKSESFDRKSEKARQEGKLSSLINKSFIIAGYQLLRSTHIDHFTGFNVMAGCNITSKISLGLGVEDAYGQSHDDNGLKLSEIRLVPVIINARYIIAENHIIEPFIELSTGITFIKYYEKVKVPLGSPYITETDGIYNFGPPFLVQDKGLYTYIGSGTYFRISKHFMPFVGFGFKGYHMSFDNLTINPRGINFEIGCRF